MSKDIKDTVKGKVKGFLDRFQNVKKSDEQHQKLNKEGHDLALEVSQNKELEAALKTLSTDELLQRLDVKDKLRAEQKAAVIEQLKQN